MEIGRKIIFSLFLLAAICPQSVLASSDSLRDLYNERGDLQLAFDASTLAAKPASGAGFLIDLEDWARQYGWQEYPELSAYAPVEPPARPLTGASNAPTINAASYIVIDDQTGTILAAQNADQSWPIASITKLVTSKVTLDAGADLYSIGEVLASDDVGGAKLYVAAGTTFTGRDLLYAALVGSANNAANALSRLSGLSRTNFVSEMNDVAADLNLTRTKFVDPTGIELENVSTAREVAALAHEAFSNENIRRAAGTSVAHIQALSDPTYTRDIKSTDWLLYDSAYDDLYVTAGKTGFLYESGWNLVVRMHPMGQSEDKSVLVVVFGSAGRRESFDNAANLARWSWKNFDWSRGDVSLAAQ